MAAEEGRAPPDGGFSRTTGARPRGGKLHARHAELLQAFFAPRVGDGRLRRVPGVEVEFPYWCGYSCMLFDCRAAPEQAGAVEPDRADGAGR